MSFRCDSCGEAQAAGVAAIKTVTKIRNRGNGYEYRGTEIAEEKNLCAVCHDPDVEPEIVDSGSNPVLDSVGSATFVESAQ